MGPDSEVARVEVLGVVEEFPVREVSRVAPAEAMAVVEEEMVPASEAGLEDSEEQLASVVKEAGEIGEPVCFRCGQASCLDTNENRLELDLYLPTLQTRQSQPWERCRRKI